MKETLDFLLDNYGVVTAATTAFVSAVVFIRKKFNNVKKFFSILDNFMGLFGENAPVEIKNRIDEIENSLEVMSIRQEIHETYIQTGICIFQPLDGKLRFSNDYANDLFGLDSKQMIDYGWTKGIPNQDRDEVFLSFKNAIENTMPWKSSFFVENETTKEGYKVDTETYIVYNSEEEITCYVGLVVKSNEKDLQAH